MALFTKPIETALKARDTATAEANQWEAKAAAMRAEADQLDASANAAIVADDTAAERITTQVLTLQRKARAYTQAASEARIKADTAAKDILRTEADELDKEASKIRRAMAKVEADVAKAKATLEEIAGHGFIPGEPTPNGTTISVPGESPRTTKTYRTGKASMLRKQALNIEVQAQTIRYWLSNGKLPHELTDLNEHGGKHEVPWYNSGVQELSEYEYVTDSLREAMAAAPENEGE